MKTLQELMRWSAALRWALVPAIKFGPLKVSFTHLHAAHSSSRGASQVAWQALCAADNHLVH